jgi:hypothetical protein
MALLPLLLLLLLCPALALPAKSSLFSLSVSSSAQHDERHCILLARNSNQGAPVSSLQQQQQQQPLVLDYSYNKFNAQQPIQQQQGQNTLLPLLMRRVSSQAVTVLFAMLLWRSLSLYEFLNGATTVPLSLPWKITLGGLIALNGIGLALSLLQKQRLKTILKGLLAITTMSEWMQVGITLSKITLVPGGWSELYGQLLMNILWATLCMSYVRARWV